MEHYLSLNSYLKKEYGHKLYKLALDGGFSCPNRDGTLGTRGCIFCSGRGSGDFAAHAADDVPAAIEKAKALVAAKNPSGKYIAYFQNFTGTYAPIGKLKALYTAAINHPDIEILSIATRPDCLGDEVLELLGQLNRLKPVWVELGLQTVHETSAEYIRRGYALSVYDEAVRKLKALGINVIVHMIIGLPGESPEMIYETASYIGRSGADGVKFQLLHILRGTDLAADYLDGRFKELSLEEYTGILAGCIQRIPPHMVVHRLTGDGAKRDLIAPLWSGNKKSVLNYINSSFDKMELKQGSLLYENGKTP